MNLKYLTEVCCDPVTFEELKWRPAPLQEYTDYFRLLNNTTSSKL